MAFYLAVARSMRIPVGFAELALVVPISFIVQMLPIVDERASASGRRHSPSTSRGFGLPIESALLVSFVGAAVIMLFSLSGGAVYLARLRAGTRSRQPTASPTKVSPGPTRPWATVNVQ